MLLDGIKDIKNGRCVTKDGPLGDLVGQAINFATEITEKNAKGTDSKQDWFENLGLSEVTKALIRLFSSSKKISDNDLHALAEVLKVDPSELEEEIYSLLQSFFSKGKYMSSEDIIPDDKELEMGDSVELEHTDNPVIARKISLDHLAEMGDYYTRLAQMEKAGETIDGGIGSGVQGHVTSRHNAPGGFIQENSHALMTNVGNNFVIWSKQGKGQELKKIGESSNAQQAAKMYWSIRDSASVHDGGIGSGIKGHVTAKQMAAMKERRAKGKTRYLHLFQGQKPDDKSIPIKEDVYQQYVSEGKKLLKKARNFKLKETLNKKAAMKANPPKHIWEGNLHKGKEKVNSFLKDHPYVEDLPSDFLNKMAEQGFKIKYKKNDIIIELPSGHRIIK